MTHEASPTSPPPPPPSHPPTPPPPDPPSPAQDEHAFEGHAALVSALTLVSRVAGSARDVVLARALGDGPVASAFAAAFAIPNLFRRLFGEGALSASVLPEYTRLTERDPRAADEVASLVVGLLFVVTSAVTMGAMALLFALLAMLPADADRDLFLRLAIIMLPYMPMICCAAILSGLLQAHRRFVPGAASPVLLNGCLIAGALVAVVMSATHDAERVAYAVAVAALVAGVLQVGWSAWALRGLVQWTRSIERARGPVSVMLRRFLPAMIGLGALQLNAFIDTAIAMYPNWVGPTVFGVGYPLDKDSNGILFFSQRLYQFPLGVFGIAVATAVFPALSRAASDPSAFVGTLRRGLRLSFFIALPASVGLILVRDDLVRVLYSGGTHGFSERGSARAALILLGYAPAIWAYSLNHVLARGFYALGDTRTPMRVAIGMMVLNLTLNMVLIWPLAEAGLAWATAIAAVVQCGVMMWILARRTGVTLIDAATRMCAARVVGASAAMALGVWVLQVVLPGAAWGERLLRLGVAAAFGSFAYAAVSYALRSEELGVLESMVLRRVRGRGRSGG